MQKQLEKLHGKELPDIEDISDDEELKKSLDLEPQPESPQVLNFFPYTVKFVGLHLQKIVA